jgi:hypothetical protein
VDLFCSTIYKLSLRYGFDQDLYYVLWTIDPGPLQDGYRIVDRLRESWLSNAPVNDEMTIPLFFLDLT